jgi:glutamyl-tRNA synthetase
MGESVRIIALPMEGVRVRYAPSPTGFQHIGGVRTALFNYLFARAAGGKFILRIEDTDRERYQPEALEDIYRTFAWLGFHWDEGPDLGGPCAPYQQSERVELYRRHAQQLVEAGRAYRCYCSPARLESLKEEQRRAGLPLGYDRRCRGLAPEERGKLEARGERLGERPVIRLAVPLEGSTVFEDRLLGRIQTANRDVSPDPVLLKSDRFPTYHLANVVDDHLMGISHILRAQEWLPSTPLHVLLYEAFGWTPPAYCHLPMVNGPDGQKLSKRHGATRVAEFREKGYLPEALVNYVALLGWSYDATSELFSLAELERLFSLERLNKASAQFDYKKLDWFNGLYIRKLDPQRLGELLLPFLQRAGLVADPPAAGEAERVRGLVPLVQPRLVVLGDVVSLARFLFQAVQPAVEDLVPKKLDRPRAAQLLQQAAAALEGFDSRGEQDNEAVFRALAEKLGVKLGDLLQPVRVAVTGSRASPPLFGCLSLLGAEEVRRRVRLALELLS